MVLPIQMKGENSLSQVLSLPAFLLKFFYSVFNYSIGYMFQSQSINHKVPNYKVPSHKFPKVIKFLCLSGKDNKAKEWWFLIFWDW